MGRRGTLVATALVLAGALSACGGSSSSSGAGAGGGAGAPTDASMASFCKAFVSVDADANTDPADIAAKLDAVGTPTGISVLARQGFEVLVAHVRDLPDNPNNRDLTALVNGLDSSDRSAVTAFLTYFGKQCEPKPSDSPGG